MGDCGLCAAPVADKYRLVRENDHAYASIIFNPVNATHQIIAPKQHRLSLGEFDPIEAKGVFDLQYEVQRRMMELFPEHPPVISTQTGKLSTVPHIHWQAYSSDAHIRQLYARAHEPADNPIGGRGIIWKDERTHPVVPGSENSNLYHQKNLEGFLGAAAEALSGSGDVERDRKRLKELTYELLRYNQVIEDD